MNKRIDFTKLGGAFIYQDTLEFMQDSYYESLNEIAKFVGEKFVISGMIDDGAGNVTDGYLCVNGERVKFTGGASTGHIIVEEVIVQEGFDDGNLKDFFYTKTARFGAIGGFDYADLKRLPFNAASVGEAVTTLADIVKKIIQFEPEVILSGCIVSNITSGPAACDISAGLVMFDGKILNSPAYSGIYPAYLKPDGSWVAAVPGAGLYIKFDPHTSQRYKNVLDRAITPDERIVMQETLTDRFDTGTGLGRWEMKGYVLMQTLQSRVPKGLWYDGVPVSNVTDALHAADGNTGGEKTHTLTTPEMPSHTHGFKHNPDTGGNSFGNVWMKNDGGAANKNTEATGGGQSHNNEDPYLIIVYAKRVV